MSASTSSGRAADVGRDGEPGRDAALQARDADHEELVEVGGEDRQEVGALEDRDGVVLGELEHPLVERQPAQFAVEEPVGGQGRVVDELRIRLVVVEQICGDRRVAERAVALHRPILPLGA